MRLRAGEVPEGEAGNNAIALLVDFLAYALPKIPSLLPVAVGFWGSRDDLGPLPPDLARWDAVDEAVDTEAATLRASER